ncbi:MAG: methyltransferase domain-containing protein [Planctomycetes bacterium]|nr:methyltransferase domain-containing protein [Planctomycetota bacterium]
MFAYDQLPYSGAVEAETHPRYLEAVAMLRGIQPASLDGCRVLELGCAAGKTLLQLAEEFPTSQFIGVDLARGRIDEAKAIASEVGLKNVEFCQGSLTEVDETWGEFDYILCIGVLSWVPSEVQDQIFRVIRESLTAQGVAAVTYKTFPGWHHLNIVRDAMRYHTDKSHDPPDRIRDARKTLELFARETQANSVQGRIYRDEHKFLGNAQDDYLFHDYLTDASYPLYFHEFYRRATEHDLKYVGETNFARNNLPPDATTSRTAMADLPLVERCQMLDFLNNTAYRKSILCRGDVEMSESIDPAKLKTMRLSLREIPTPSNFEIGSSDVLTFKYESGSLGVAAPFGKAALRHLIDVYPRPVSISELCDGANSLLPPTAQHLRVDRDRGQDLIASAMLGSLEAGLIQVCVRPPEFVQTISDRPAASPLACALAKRTAIVANRCHQNVSLSNDAALILSHLDGRDDREQLKQQLVSSPDETRRTPEQRLDLALTELNNRAFLVK